MTNDNAETPRVPLSQIAPEATLPADWKQGTFVGRMERKGHGPSVVVLGNDGYLYDITASFPTTAQLFEQDDPAAAAADAVTRGEQVGRLSEILAKTPAQGGDHLLSPIDLQAVKAAGVTFAVSMVERVVESKCKGDPAMAPQIRAKIKEAMQGKELSELKPGSAEALAIFKYLTTKVEEGGLGFEHHYLEVGLGPMGEVFTKAQPLATVGHGSPAGLHPESKWNNPEPEVVLALSSKGKIVGAALGNDVNLRDIEGKSALLLGECKDQRASASVGPFIRLFDKSFSMDDVKKMDVEVHVKGPEGFTFDDKSSMSKISRAPESIVKQMFEHHDYPDGAVLYCGTMFTPNKPRGENPGFTHVIGDTVTIKSDKLGELTNVMVSTDDAPRWTRGAASLMQNLAERGLLQGQEAVPQRRAGHAI